MKPTFWRSPVIRIALGAVLGFLYYKFVGCATGSCPITRNPWTSTLYGAVIGGLVGSSAG